MAKRERIMVEYDHDEIKQQCALTTQPDTKKKKKKHPVGEFGNLYPDSKKHLVFEK